MDPLPADRGNSGIVVVDGACRVLYLNPAACELLGVVPKAALNTPCWKLLGLLTPEHQPHCSSDCRLLEELQTGNARNQARVVRRCADGSFATFDLFHSLLSRPENGGMALMHILSPASYLTAADEARGSRTRHRPAAANHVIDLNQLSRRELEVLRLLADGCTTDKIANELFISPVTVKHHIQHILEKLAVHRRVEAVLAWVNRER